MKVYHVPNALEHPHIKPYLDVNNIPWTSWNEWEFGKTSSLKMPKGKSLVIMSPAVLKDVDLNAFKAQVDASDCILYFAHMLDCTQLLYDVDENDGLMSFADYLRTLDAEIYFHVDALPERNDERIVTKSLFVFGTSIMKQPRIKNTFTRNKDFLLLTIVRKTRPHRHIFYEQIKQTNLLQNFIGNISDWYDVDDAEKIRTKQNDDLKANPGKVTPLPLVKNRVGSAHYVPGLSEEVGAGVIPWDLYHQSHYEVVLETYGKHYTYYTDKVLRPIVAQLPFVALSNHKFYNDLHEHGFETFGDIIDESFASEPDLDTRVRKLLISMQNIDPREFFELSKEKCAHNYDNLSVQSNRDYLRFFEDLDVFFEKIGLTK